MRARRSALVLVALLAALGGPSACGDEDTGLRARVGTTDDAEAEGRSDEPAAPAGDAPAFCAAVGGFDYLGAIEAPTPDELREAYADFEERADEIVAAAPPEIRDDVEVTVDSGRRIKALIEEHDYVITDAVSDPEFVEILDPEVVDASLRLDDYVKQNC